jgi:hypothetical protein
VRVYAICRSDLSCSLRLGSDRVVGVSSAWRIHYSLEVTELSTNNNNNTHSPHTPRPRVCQSPSHAAKMATPLLTDAVAGGACEGRLDVVDRERQSGAGGHFVGRRDDPWYCVCMYLLLQYLLQSCSRGGKGDSGGHVLRETTSRGLCGIVCPSHTSERGGEGDCVKDGGGEEGERERCVRLIMRPSILRLILSAAAWPPRVRLCSSGTGRMQRA